MSQNIFIRQFLISIFILSFLINTSFAGTKGPGESCSLSNTTECISGYTCKSNVNFSENNGVCTKIVQVNNNTENNNNDKNVEITNFSSIGNLLTDFNKNILQNLIVLMSGVALVVFLYGLVKFIYDRANGNTDKIAKDRESMLWGLAALFVFVSVWGIIRMFQDILGVSGDNNINLPKICTNGNCNTPSSQSAAGGIGGDAGIFNDPTIGLIDGSYTADSINAWVLPLKNGSNGKDVAELQKFLKEHRYSIGNSGIDAKFGPSTKAAVEAFQKDNNLTVDGVVDDATRQAILSKLNTSNNQNYNEYPELSIGSTDKNTGDKGYVTDLQNRINNLECRDNAGDSLIVDGNYGLKTYEAVKKFQDVNYLKVDGIIGGTSWAALLTDRFGDGLNKCN